MRRALVFAALAAAVWPAAASAHAVLVRSEPGDGAVLARAPAVVRLVFDDAVRPGRSEAVRDGGGPVAAGPARLAPGSGRVILVPLRPGLPNGDYSVRWRAISDDGHRIEGVLAFAVGAGRAPPVPTLAAGGAGPRAEDVLARWVFLTGMLLAGGAAAFALVVLRGVPRRVVLLLLAGFALALGGALWLVHGQPGGTRFVRAFDAGAVVAGAGIALAALALVSRRARLAACVPALLLVPVPSVAGHALDAGQPQALSVAADIVHVAAAAVWLGGLAALALVLPAARSTVVARRFSALALGAVLVLVATGVVRAVVELSAVQQLWSSGYGRALLVKTGLLAGLLGLGWISRSGLPRLRTTVTGELVLLAGVVVAVAFLTDLAPGRTLGLAARPVARTEQGPPARPPPGTVVLAAQDRGLAVALAARRGPPLQLTATVVAPSGNGLSGLDVRLGSAPARPCGPGCYRAAVPGSPRSVTVDLGDRGTVRFPLPRLPAPSGVEVLRQATREFRSLRTLVIHERLASNPVRVLRTTYRIASPNRLTYRISNGDAAVVIGDRRWDRVPGGRWEASSQSPLELPAPFWGPRPANVHLLGSGRVGRRPVWIVSFFDPLATAWFTVRIDQKTARTLDLTMVAAAHFMHHRYTGFDKPLRIAPPA